jgi:nicotinamide riboside kinase
MRVAFIGTQSTGKTTLLNRLCESHDEIYSICGVARSIIARGFPLGKKATMDSNCLFMSVQLSRESEYNPVFKDHLVSDRCMVDLLAHARVNRKLAITFLPEYMIELIEYVTVLSCRSYDLFFYFPVEFPQLNDGIREEDDNYRLEIGKEILQIAIELKLPMITITGTVDERLGQVLTEIRKSG